MIFSSENVLKIIDVGFSVYQYSISESPNSENSLIISAGNAGVYAGFDFVTAEYARMYKAGTLKASAGFGWVGFSVSIDFLEIIKSLFGGT